MALTSEALANWIGSHGKVREASGLAGKLTAAAEGFVSLGVFGRALLILYNDTLLGPCTGAAGLSEDEIHHISGRSMEARFYERLTAKASVLSRGLYLVKHQDYAMGEMDELIPSKHAPGEFAGDWHPDDMFLAPFKTSLSDEVGNLTGDDPFHGRTPEGDELRLVEIYLNEVNWILEAETARRSDSFTGLANELWAEDVLHREDQRDEPFSVFYASLGDMDARSERLGRAYQGELVKAFGAIVKDVTPGGAGAARLHGTEYVVMMRVGDPGRMDGIESQVKRRLQAWNEKERPEVAKRLGLVTSLLNDPASMIHVRMASAIRREDESARQVLRRAETASRNLFGKGDFGQE